MGLREKGRESERGREGGREGGREKEREGERETNRQRQREREKERILVFHLQATLALSQKGVGGGRELQPLVLRVEPADVTQQLLCLWGHSQITEHGMETVHTKPHPLSMFPCWVD